MSGIRSRLGMMSVLAFSIICGSAAARADTMLHYQFKEGQTLPYTMEQKVKMNTNVGGMDFAAEMNQTIDISWHIKSVDKDGKAQMVQKFDRVRLNMSGPMGNVEYDSKDGKELEGPIGKVLGPIMSALAGAEFSLTMDARGQVSDIKIPEKLNEAFKKIPGGGLAGGDLGSEEGIKHLIVQAGLTLPQGTATKGKSWTKEITQKAPFGKIKVIDTNTYEGPTTVDGKQLEQISLKPQMSVEAEGNAQVTIKVKSQDAKGTAYFDNKAGRLVETKLTQNLQMEVDAMGRTINNKIEQTVTMKLNEKK